jgi:hypothetical protein
MIDIEVRHLPNMLGPLMKRELDARVGNALPGRPTATLFAAEGNFEATA